MANSNATTHCEQNIDSTKIILSTQCANPDEKIYEEWDCPQAVAAHNYVPTEEDQLGLSPGDVVNVLRKLSDGWYYGERIGDKRGGWFPSSYVQQLMNDHVRAQKYKQRFRVLQVW